MARMHSHAGVKGEHPVTQAHRSGAAITAHDRELREHARDKIKTHWTTKKSEKEPLHKLQPFTRPSTMDAKTHKHFQKIVAGEIAKHQQEHNLPAGYVKKDFHQVVMPVAWRKLKETHYQASTGAKWQKKD
jgi:hypothetical protein